MSIRGGLSGGKRTRPPGQSRKVSPPTEKTLNAAARREFLEETGAVVSGEFIDLGAQRQPGGKTVVAFACEGDFDPARLSSNMFAMEWPPRSGRMAEFPEVDKAGWFSMDEALVKATKGQRPIIEALARTLGVRPATNDPERV